MFLASGGPPDAMLAVVVLVAGALASGGANALNHFLDRDIDARMRRTSNRPVAAMRVQPREALLFGVAANLVAFVMFATLVNVLSAFLALASTLFYVFVYTMALKRTTPQNIVIGGAAGALPPVIGWTAVTGSVGLPALYMFAIVFFWTPPHFWALALMLKDDYAKAGVPMLPVVVGVAETKKSILLYSVLLLALTSMFFSTRAVGWIYLARLPGAGAPVHLPRGRPAETPRYRRGPGHISLLPRILGAALHRDSRRRLDRLASPVEYASTRPLSRVPALGAGSKPALRSYLFPIWGPSREKGPEVALTPRIEYGAGSSALRQAQESQAQGRLRPFPLLERGKRLAGDGFPPRIGVRGRLCAGTTHAGCDRHTKG